MSAPLGIGIRSGSYGSLDKQVQNGSARKATKMLKEKEKERLFLWICKFAGRKKVGMLFLCLISAAVFIWVLYVGKGSLTVSFFLSFLYLFIIAVLNCNYVIALSVYYNLST